MAAAVALAAEAQLTQATGSGAESPGTWSSGAAWGDYDGDGDLDLFVTNWGTGRNLGFTANSLYRNGGDGTYEDVAGALDLDLPEFDSSAAAWADYDNDGDLDLYVANTFTDKQDYLYLNDGSSFTEVGRSLGFVNVEKRGWVFDADWGDYDGDGWLDLYLAKLYYANAMYHNQENRTLQGNRTLQWTTDVGAGDRRDTNAFSWVDYDGDGDLDLYTVNREQENGLYENRVLEEGSFVDVAASLGVADTEMGQDDAWGDYDNDGDLDLYLANVGANGLYRSAAANGGGAFANVAADADLRLPGGWWLSSAAAWADFDGDGLLDLYVANGGDEQLQGDALLANEGDGSFRDATVEAGLPPGRRAHLAVAVGDHNGDGPPDVYVTDGWGYGNQLLLNGAGASRFIRVALKGKGADGGGSNLQGYGAEIWLIENVSQDTVAYRQVLPGAADLRTVDGVGYAEVVFGAPGGPYDVKVRFPGSEDRYGEVRVVGGARVEVVED